MNESRNNKPDFSISQALLSLEIWLIFFSTILGLGAVVTVVNNLGQIGLALGYSKSQTNTCVSLLGLSDCIGAVLTGAVSDKALQKYGIPRPFFFCLMLALLAAANLSMAFAIPGALYVGSVLAEISLGGQWAVLLTIINEIFGLKNYATLQNIPMVGKGVGMYFLSVKLAGLLYDRQAGAVAAW